MSAVSRVTEAGRGRTADGAAGTEEEGVMYGQASFGPRDGMAQRPLAELLQCPPAIGSLLNGSTQCLNFEAGMVVFRQSEACRGLYVLVSGQFLRRTERLEARITLGISRAGELVELAAALGDKRHTYALTAQTQGSVLLLPIEALQEAFMEFPPLRMQLLEELAREVSRGYVASCQNRILRTRRRSAGASLS
jgi:CRP-like cAMP-binding protein